MIAAMVNVLIAPLLRHAVLEDRSCYGMMAIPGSVKWRNLPSGELVQQLLIAKCAVLAP